MPFVQAVVVIGALGLVGLPIANGFFSKDLILEGGLAGGPFWLYIVMLFSVGVTALYSLRMVRMVFGGEPHGPVPTHDGLPAMRVSLALLAVGTLTSWLLAGPLGRMLSATLPTQHLQVETTWTLVGQILRNPATWITLAVIGLGFGVWAARKTFARPAKALKPLAERGLGFEWLNRQIVSLTKRAGSFLQRFQTGQLNWNVAGILGGLIVILLVLAGVR